MLRRYLPYLAGYLSGMLTTVILLLLSSPPRGHPIELQPVPTLAPMQIHVTGAVNNPGVYELPIGAIVEHAIEAAGGAQNEAALANLNLAEQLHDGERVLVPDRASTNSTTEQSSSSEPTAADDGLLSLNEATEPELERLPGIGPSLAQAIVRFRLEHGPFQQVEDLTKVPGIGPAKLDAIRDLVELP